MSFLNDFSRRLGVPEYLGVWNATTNTPPLVNGAGQRGGYYIVSTAGTTLLDGINEWKVGDWAIFSGTVWQRIDNTSIDYGPSGGVKIPTITTLAREALLLEPAEVYYDIDQNRYYGGDGQTLGGRGFLFDCLVYLIAENFYVLETENGDKFLLGDEANSCCPDTSLIATET